jgi:glucokinase
MDTYIAVDVGGTHIRVAVYPTEGIEPLQVKRIHTTGKKETPADRLIDLIAELWPKGDRVRAIGVAAPGYLDPKVGIVILAANIPGWVNFPLREKLQEKFGVPVLLGNDANLAALGEWRYGAARGYHNVLYLTISTGIGGGVIINDNLLLGQRGLAAELGHLTVLPEGPMCGCGHRGHLEALASGPAIARYAKEQLALGVPSILKIDPPPTAYDVSIAAQAGDALAKEAFTYAGHYLGIGVANLLATFNPSIIVLGGGVSHSGALLIDPMKASLERNILSPEYTRDLSIVTAELGDDAGLVGALALAHTAAG